MLYGGKFLLSFIIIVKNPSIKMTQKESLAMKPTLQTFGVTAGTRILVGAAHRILHPSLAQEPFRHRGEALDCPSHVPVMW